MPEIVVRTEGLSKVYPLATSTRQRLLYVLGFGGSGPGRVATRAAVSQLDLEIRRGEKVGIVGRNGSGKSTLLGMISGTIQPSHGHLAVRGSIHALLQLGAGFNDELTGCENARSYLAMHGVSGKDADRCIDEIAEFAEIGIYFDQPVKTYSSGMRLRLMFAAATSITPDILILDEVLSVGDAYFVGKSFDRMRRLCTDDGTTLLVVSHSVNMLPELCDRIIWIDKGDIRMDGDAGDVARAYDAFIRGEEENRLRRMQSAMPVRQLPTLPGEPSDDRAVDMAAASGDADPASRILGEIRMPDGQPPRHRLLVRRIELLQAGGRIADIPIGDGERAGDAMLLTDTDAGNWGAYENDENGGGRLYLPYGSPFHKLPFLMSSATVANALTASDVEVRLTCDSEKPMDIEAAFHRFETDRFWDTALSFAGERQGETVIGNVTEAEQGEPVGSSGMSSVANGRFGTRRIEFLDVEFLGEGDQPRLVYSLGAQLRVRIRYRINDPELVEKAEVALAFQKDGLQVTNRFLLDEYRFSASLRREGEIVLDASPLLLAQGEYVVSVAIHAPGHATQKTPRQPVSVAQTVYDMYYRYFHITVFEPYHTTLLRDVIFQHPATWRVGDEEFSTRVITD